MELIHRRHFPVDHYVLVDVDGTVPPGTLIAEAWRQAPMLALTSTGDARNFTLIQNGSKLARREWPHIHIVCAKTRFQKGLIYLLLGMKNLLPLC